MIDVLVATEIDAPADAVWAVLVDFPRYAEWNPFIVRATGAAAIGARVHVRVSRGLRFAAKVLACEPNRELRWRGHFLGRRVASGEHTFAIEPIREGRVRLVQREVFEGLVPRLVGRLLASEVRRGFEAMNVALKARAEARARTAAKDEPTVSP